MCHIHRPESPSATAFVFAFPGYYEQKEGRPCAGDTGRNLNLALAELHACLPDPFPIANDRYQYLITNAWPQVEYNVGPKRPKGTGRSVPEFVEVLTWVNIERLRGELDGCRVVVACGEHAQIAVKACVEFLGLPARVAYAAHTSTQGLRAFGGDTQPILRWADGVARQLHEMET